MQAHIENFYPVLKELVQCEDVFNFYDKSDDDMSFIYNTFAGYKRDIKTYNSSNWLKYVKPDELEVLDETVEYWGSSFKVLIKCENQRKYMVLVFEFVRNEERRIKDWLEEDESNICLFKPGFLMHHIKDEYKRYNTFEDSDDESVDFEDEATECPICFADFKEEDLMVCKPCGHCVCEECYNHINHCPLCRKEIKKKDSYRGPEIDMDYISECIETYNGEELMNIIDIDTFVEDVVNQDGVRHTLHYEYEEYFNDFRVIVAERDFGKLDELNEREI